MSSLWHVHENTWASLKVSPWPPSAVLAQYSILDYHLYPYNQVTRTLKFLPIPTSPYHHQKVEFSCCSDGFFWRGGGNEVWSVYFCVSFGLGYAFVFALFHLASGGVWNGTSFFFNNCPLSVDLASVPLLCALPFLIPQELSTLMLPAGYPKPAHGPRTKMGRSGERMFDVSQDQSSLGWFGEAMCSWKLE